MPNTLTDRHQLHNLRFAEQAFGYDEGKPLAEAAFSR
jgi:hypothetical protein